MEGSKQVQFHSTEGEYKLIWLISGAAKSVNKAYHYRVR